MKTEKILKITLEGEDIETFEDIDIIVNNYFSSYSSTNTTSDRLIEQGRIKSNKNKILSLLNNIKESI